MKKMKWTLMLAGGLGLAGVWFVTHPAIQPSADASTTSVSTGVATITVIGRSDAQVTPGLAVIDAGLSTSGSDAQTAQQGNDSKMQKLLTALKSAGVPSANIRTEWYSIHPNYASDKTGSQALDGFQAVDDIKVQLTDLTQVGNIVDLLVKSGANQINNVSYEVANPAKIEEQAYSAALADAKAQANNIAQSLGLTISGVQSVDTTNAGGTLGPIDVTSSAQSSTTVSPGTQDVMTTVKVVYTLASGTGQ